MKEQGITSLQDFKAAKEANKLKLAEEQQQAVEIAQEQAQSRAAAQMSGSRSSGPGPRAAPPRTGTSQTTSTTSSSGPGPTAKLTTVFKRVGPSTGQRVPYPLKSPAVSGPNKLAELEARIEALEGTSAPSGDLIEQFKALDPHAPDLAKIRALEERIKFWESEQPGPAPEDLGEVTAGSEAARRATYKRLEQLELNRQQGTAGELRVEADVLAGKTIPGLNGPATLRGTQVHIMTKAGLRKVDLLVELPGTPPELVALEVKTGQSAYTEYQQLCDQLLELEGGTVINGPADLLGKIRSLRTVVVRL